MNSDNRRLRPRPAQFFGLHNQRCDGAATHAANAEHPPASCRYTYVAALNRIDRGKLGVLLLPAQLGDGRPRREVLSLAQLLRERKTAGGSDRD